MGGWVNIRYICMNTQIMYIQAHTQPCLAIILTPQIIPGRDHSEFPHFEYEHRACWRREGISPRPHREQAGNYHQAQ